MGDKGTPEVETASVPMDHKCVVTTMSASGSRTIVKSWPEHDPGQPIGFLMWYPGDDGARQQMRYRANVDAVHVGSAGTASVVHICECLRCGSLVKVVPKNLYARG